MGPVIAADSFLVGIQRCLNYVFFGLAFLGEFLDFLTMV